MATVKRKISGKTNKVGGTGTIDESVSNGSDGWADASANKLESAEKVKDILVKTIPIVDIRADQDNPRKLEIDIDLVNSIAEKHSLETYIKNEDDNEWITDFVDKVEKEFCLKGKQIEDFKSIVEFSNVLKSPERLLHPIVVWKEEGENVFHLIAGERRVLAHCLLNATHIAAKININKLTQNEVDLFQWEENESRLDFNLYERITRVEKFINANGGESKTSIKKFHKSTGLGRTIAGNYLKIIRYESPILIEAIKDKKITSLKEAGELSKLSVEDLTEHLKGNIVKSKNSAPATVVARPNIKVTRDSDNNALNKMISAVVEKYDASSAIENLDLKKPKDVNLALNALLLFLEDKEG